MKTSREAITTVTFQASPGADRGNTSQCGSFRSTTRSGSTPEPTEAPDGTASSGRASQGGRPSTDSAIRAVDAAAEQELRAALIAVCDMGPYINKQAMGLFGVLEY